MSHFYLQSLKTNPNHQKSKTFTMKSHFIKIKKQKLKKHTHGSLTQNHTVTRNSICLWGGVPPLRPSSPTSWNSNPKERRAPWATGPGSDDPAWYWHSPSNNDEVRWMCLGSRPFVVHSRGFRICGSWNPEYWFDGKNIRRMGRQQQASQGLVFGWVVRV